MFSRDHDKETGQLFEGWMISSSASPVMPVEWAEGPDKSQEERTVHCKVVGRLFQWHCASLIYPSSQA